MSVNNHASETLRGPLPPNAELLPAFGFGAMSSVMVPKGQLFPTDEDAGEPNGARCGLCSMPATFLHQLPQTASNFLFMGVFFFTFLLRKFRRNAQ